MKTNNPAVLAIIATGSCLRADLWTFQIPGGSTYYFTTKDTAITVSGITYQTGLTIQRGDFVQKNTLEVQSLDLTVSPQPDSPNYPILIEGQPFLQAAKFRVFDKAIVTWSKLFLASWADTSPGAVPWGTFGVNQVIAGRQSADFTLNSKIEMLNVQMPRNIVQGSCLHTLFDAGCTLNPSLFQVSGAVVGAGTVTGWNTTLTQVDDYFSRGVLTWTSGANSGLTRTIKLYKHVSGTMTPIQPLPNAAQAGDTFTILPACKKTQAGCSNTNTAVGPPLNNLAHFRGAPYVPNPETLYDGGASSNSQVPTPGKQGGASVGSRFSGNIPIALN